MKHLTFSTCSLALVTSLLAGCDYSSREGTNSPLWGGYDDKTIYVAVDDVFLLSVDPDNKPYLAASPPGERKPSNRIYNAPRTMSASQLRDQQRDYTDGRHYNLKTIAVGIIPKGTRFEVAEVRKETQFSWFFGGSNITVIYAQILDSDHRGKVVDIRDMSLEQPVAGEKAVAYKPDPAFLRPAGRPKEQS